MQEEQKLEFELVDQAENQQLMHHQVLPLGTNNLQGCPQQNNL